MNKIVGYAVAYYASRKTYDPSGDAVMGLFLISAESEADAMAQGLELAKVKYPDSDWCGHAVIAQEVAITMPPIFSQWLGGTE